MYRNVEKRKRRRKWPWILAGLVLVTAVLGTTLYLLEHYKVETVYVDGNLHYTKDEIIQIVMEGPLGDNSLYLSYRYKNKSITDVPFVAAMDVVVVTPDTIRIIVYEKSLAGYVEYLDRYMYFDKEGTIVESSTVKTAGIPQITGLKYDYVVLEEPLPVEDPGVFQQVLSITQSLGKYELAADRIYFNNNQEMTIYFGSIKVIFGTDKWLDEKIIRMRNILPELEGMSGTLQLGNFNQNTKTYTFEPD